MNDKVLRSIYYDVKHPDSYSTSYKLYTAAKKKIKNISLKEVNEFLEGEDVYTLHKQPRKPNKYRKTVAHNIHAIHQADLIDVTPLYRENEGFKFILTNIDVFSRKAWAIPIKNKTGVEVRNAFMKIHKENKPEKIHTDLGKEFLNATVQEYFKNVGIEHYTSQSDFKAAVCERFNRTLKSKLWKYFTKKGNLNYTHALNDIVETYNNTKHSSIKTAPNNVTKKNRNKIWRIQFPPTTFTSKKKFRFKIGDFVRLSKLQHIFAKKYLPTFTKEIFIIADRLKTSPPTYRVMDMNDELIKGSFYENEMTRVKIHEENKKGLV